MHPFVQQSEELTNRLQDTCQYPDIATTEGGRSFVVWQENRDHDEFIQLTCIEPDGKRTFTKRISGAGLSLRPSVHVKDDDVFVVWSQFIDDRWKIELYIMNGLAKESLCVVESGEALFYPYVTDDGVDPVVLYCRQKPGRSECVMATYHAGTFRYEVASKTNKAYRPTGTLCGKKDFFVCYDAFTGSGYDVFCRIRKNGAWGEEWKLNRSGMRCAQPVAARFSESGITVGWYENGPSSDFSYNVIDVSCAGRDPLLSNYHVLIKNRNWYNNVDAGCNKKGVVVFTYTIGKTNMLMRYRTSEGSWSKPVVGSFNDTQCCVRPKVSVDGEDAIHYVWQYARRNGHQNRNSSVIYNKVSLHDLDSFDDADVETTIDKFVQPIDVDKEMLAPQEKEKQEWLHENGLDGYQLLFGDIHGQSNMSDGMGELDQYYHYAMVDRKMDFCALTDHDCYPDVATDSEWEWNRTTRNLFNAEKDFVALLAYEWTSNEYKHDFGHKNVYYPGSVGRLYTSCDPKGMNPDRLYASIKKDGGQCIPHHVAADWGSVSAATDWDYHDPEATRVTEIFSRHADYERTETLSKYTKNIKKFDHCCVQDALARGYRLGFIAGSDSHQMEHGKEGGILGAFMTERSSQALWDALWKRRVYATTGDRILLSFRINGHFMGEEFSTNEARTITGSVLSMHAIRKVEVIKNNDLLVAYPSAVGKNTFAFSFVDPASSSCDYYYLRMEEEDEQRAWSSPIWVDCIQMS